MMQKIALGKGIALAVGMAALLSACDGVANFSDYDEGSYYPQQGYVTGPAPPSTTGYHYQGNGYFNNGTHYRATYYNNNSYFRDTGSFYGSTFNRPTNYYPSTGVTGPAPPSTTGYYKR
jgi:hypothetical protein